MELASIRIFVSDLPAAVKFYVEVVGLKQTWDTPEAVGFGYDPVIILEQIGTDEDDEALVPRFTGVAFRTPDAEAMHKKLLADGVPMHGPPKQQPWGGILLHADDPSGNTITFVQPPA